MRKQEGVLFGERKRREGALLERDREGVKPSGRERKGREEGLVGRRRGGKKGRFGWEKLEGGRRAGPGLLGARDDQEDRSWVRFGAKPGGGVRQREWHGSGAGQVTGWVEEASRMRAEAQVQNWVEHRRESDGLRSGSNQLRNQAGWVEGVTWAEAMVGEMGLVD